ncbi:uncharacterized mitochondrial protein-like protein [Tanacetum coccineum]
MDVKSAFLYGKIEEEVYVCQPPGFEDPYFPDRVYKVEKALYGLHQALRACRRMAYLCQDKYVVKILKKFGFTEVKTASTPMETQKPLLKDEDGEEVDVYMYRSMIGSLMYLTSSRPDIMFAVCACARYQVNPKVSHLHAVKRIFRYLKGQPKLGLWYPKDSPFDLVAYTDSDYAGASLDRKSTTGEAEYVAASSCCGQVLWIQNQLLDYGAKTTAWNEFSSTMASAIICLATNQKFNFSKYIFESMVRNLDNLSGKFLMYPRFVQVFLNQQLDEVPTHKRIYDAPSHTKKIFGNMKRVGKGFSGRVTPLFPTMVVQNQSELGEGSAMPTDPHHTPTIINIHSTPQRLKNLGSLKRKGQLRAATTASSLEAEQDSGNIIKTRSKATSNESSSLGTTSGGRPRGNTLQSDEDILKLKELMELCTNLQQRVLDLEKTKTTQQNEIASLKRRVKKLEKKRSSRTHKLKRLYKFGLTARVESSRDEQSLGKDASKQGRMINAIDVDEDITLVNVQDDADNEMFDVNTLNVSTAATTVIINTEEITLAKALEALKTSKPKVKGIVLQEPELKKKKINDAILLGDDIQAKVDPDYELAERLQAEEQETKLVEGSSKRAGEKLEQKSTMTQKVDEDKDTAELQSLMEVIPDEEEFAIDDVPLATKSPSIVDWKIHKEGKKSYYQIVRADGKYQMYRVFSQMLKSFTREDLEDLYKLVKAKYGSKRPVEDLDLVLWNDLKTMFEPHFAIWNDLHTGRKEISPYATYNYRYAEQEASVTAALIDVNAAQSKLVLLENFNENYSKCLRLLYKVNAAKGVNAASEEVSTAELGLEYGRYGLEYGVLPSSGYDVLDLVSFVVFGECRHRYTVSSMMDTAYWSSEQSVLYFQGSQLLESLDVKIDFFDLWKLGSSLDAVAKFMLRRNFNALLRRNADSDDSSFHNEIYYGVEIGCNIQCGRARSYPPGHYLLEIEIEIRRMRKLMAGKRKNNFLVSDDESNIDCLITVSSDPNTFVEFKNKQGTNLFVDIQKTIKVNGRENVGNVGVTNVKWINDSSIVKKTFFKAFKDGFFNPRETIRMVMHGDVVDGVLVIFLNGAWNFLT